MLDKLTLLNFRILLINFVAFGILFFASACGSFPDLQPSDKVTNRMEIFIYEDDSHEKLGSEKFGFIVNNDLSSLNPSDLETADIVITEDDIVSYDWALQKIVLKNRESRQIDLNGSFISDYSAFIIAFDGKPLFSGLVLLTISPNAIDSPVLYVEPTSFTPDLDGLVVYLRPQYDIIFPDNIAESPFPGEDKELAEQLRNHLEAVGKLSK
jgi:hypothetical protein